MAQSIGELEYLVLLGVLRLAGRGAYGISLRDEILERTGRGVSLGAIYTALGRLEGKGFLSHRMGEATAARGGRRKKLFRLTVAGERALALCWDEQRRMARGLEAHLEGLGGTPGGADGG